MLLPLNENSSVVDNKALSIAVYTAVPEDSDIRERRTIKRKEKEGQEIC